MAGFPSIFGFQFKRKKDEDKSNNESFAPLIQDDGAVVVAAGGTYGTYVDLEGSARTEAELVTKYREMSLHAELDSALEDIVNEAIIVDDDFDVIEINLDKTGLSDKLKGAIRQEFNQILQLFEFNTHSYDIFRRWYIDGRLYYHVIIDDARPHDGIKEFRYIDPRKIRKVREVKKRPIPNSNVVVTQNQQEYFIYNEKGFSQNIGQNMTGTGNSTGVKISADAILHITSGLTDKNNQLVLGFLHTAIKPLNQLRTLEDATLIYRISRAPERRVFYIDVGNLPKMKAEQYLRDIMARFKNRVVYDSATGEVRDDRKFMCYALDTKIPLLDGRTLEIAKIIKEYEEGKINWVYSCDPVSGAFVPGPISWAGITKESSDVVRVTFDNGKSVVCTPDHKFPVWDKGFVEAQHLAVGESLIPGYRRFKEITKGGVEYEQIFKNDTKTWEFTHREIVKFQEESAAQEYKEPNGRTRRSSTYKGSEEWKVSLSQIAKNRVPVSKTWKILTPNGDIEIIENLNAYCRGNGLNRNNIKRDYGSKGFHAETLRNHKVVSVEFLSEKIPVAALTIDQEETYHSHHTYLLDAGVYTKNTMLEDFWLPRREGGKGTEIVTLPPGQNLGQLEDVKYFQRNLYKSLKIPVNRIEPEQTYNLGRATEITRDEVKFAKFVNRLQTRFATLFLFALEKQLILKKIITPEDWTSLSNSISFDYARDNHYAELKELEIVNNRMAAVQAVDPFVGKYFSVEWVQKNILRHKDQDIEQMMQQIGDEIKQGIIQPVEQPEQAAPPAKPSKK